MKSIKCCILLIFLLAFQSQVSVAQTQNENRIQISINTGIAVPVSPDGFNRGWHIGPGGGMGVGYKINPRVTLQLYGSYHRFAFDESGFRSDLNLNSNTSLDGGASEIGTIMGNVIFNYETFDNRVTPYFKIGGGFFRSVRSDVDVTTSTNTFTVDSDSEATFGANSAIGINYLVGRKVSAFVEIKYTTAFFESRRTQYLPINIGIIF